MNTNEIKTRVHKLISSGEVAMAIKSMLEYTKTNSLQSHSEIVALSDKFEGLSRKVRVGSISSGDAGIERAQIVMGLLETLNAL